MTYCDCQNCICSLSLTCRPRCSASLGSAYSSWKNAAYRVWSAVRTKMFAFARQEASMHYTGCGRGQPASSATRQHPRTQPFTLPVPPLSWDRSCPRTPYAHWKMPWLSATALRGLQCNGGPGLKDLLSGELCSCACTSCHHFQFLMQDATKSPGRASQWLRVCYPVLLCWSMSVAVRELLNICNLITTTHVLHMHTISCFLQDLSPEQEKVCSCRRLSQLREVGLLPQSKSSGADAHTARPTLTADSGSSPGASSGLNMDHSEAASSASGPSPPWPTSAQLKQTLAAFGRAQAEENAQTLAAR